MWPFKKKKEKEELAVTIVIHVKMIISGQIIIWLFSQKMMLWAQKSTFLNSDFVATGSSISFDTKRTYAVHKQNNFSIWFFFLLKELHLTFFVSKFHGTGSISLGDNPF